MSILRKFKIYKLLNIYSDNNEKVAFDKFIEIFYNLEIKNTVIGDICLYKNEIIYYIREYSSDINKPYRWCSFNHNEYTYDIIIKEYIPIILYYIKEYNIKGFHYLDSVFNPNNLSDELYIPTYISYNIK